MRQFKLILPMIAFLVAHLGASVAHGMYDPKHGRWLQRDPNGLLDGTEVNPAEPTTDWAVDVEKQYADGPDLLEYARSAPTNRQDVLGLTSSVCYADGVPNGDPNSWSHLGVRA